MRNFSSETSSLELWATNKEVYEGECTTVTLAFLVRDDNQLRLRFHNLGQQLYRMHATTLERPDAFLVSHNIVDIQGEDTVINNKDYILYRIFEGSYCPHSPGKLQFPAIKLMMCNVGVDIDKIEKLVEYRTTPLNINVRPLNSTAIDKFHKYKMVGSFSLHERVLDKQLMVGQPFAYQLKVKGAGLLFPVEPPRPQRTHLKITLVDLTHSDTIIGRVLHSERIFTYWITPETEGHHDLTNLFNFSYFDPLSKRRETIVSSLKIDVAPADEDISTITAGDLFFSKHNFIVIDGSQSMMIEDYQPNRLSVVREGVKKFLLNRASCDVGVVTFGGDARHIDLSMGDSCYSRTRFRHINNNEPVRGTAIGDALWFAQVSAKPGPGKKKIVVIGDGDNTAGVLSTSYAADMAKERNVRIYAIGIGNKGPVPYGRDSTGVPYMIDNTFSDQDFRMISTITGGTYYHPLDTEELVEVLREIFRDDSKR